MQNAVQNAVQNVNEENADCLSIDINALDHFRQTKKCTCSKTSCLKLYCVCFYEKTMCTMLCSCSNCFNYDNDVRNIAIENKFNSEKYHKKFVHGQVSIDDSGNLFHKSGCFCKNSKCLKKYCCCYANLAICTSMCKCFDCGNNLNVKQKNVYPYSKKQTKGTPREDDPLTLPKKILRKFEPLTSLKRTYEDEPLTLPKKILREHKQHEKNP